MKHLVKVMLAASLVWLAVAGPGPCEPRELGDSIEPLERFVQKTVQDGDVGVPVDESLHWLSEQPLHPDSLESSTATVTLRLAASGETVSGKVEGFDFVPCAAGPDCPRGLAFTPTVCWPCALGGNTTYQLEISGLVSGDGDTLPGTTVTFMTGSTAGSRFESCEKLAAEGCFMVITGNTLKETQALTGTLAGETSRQVSVTAVGVENEYPYAGYESLIGPQYVLMIQVELASGATYPLSDTVQWINVRVLGQDHKIYLPGDDIPNDPFLGGGTLALYIASDGSSYYAVDDPNNPSYHFGFFSFQICDPSTYSGCTFSNPGDAFVPGRLAAAADGSPSTEPFFLDFDSYDGMFGGIIDGSTDWSGLQIWAFAIGADPPYWGHNELASYTKYNMQLQKKSFVDSGIKSTEKKRGFIHRAPHLVAQWDWFRFGADSWSCLPPRVVPINTPDSWLLLFIENREPTELDLAGYTLSVTDNGTTVPVSLPVESIPAMEALPLYVRPDGSTQYAYESGTDHTLDLRLNDCYVNCPIMDPATAHGSSLASP